MVEGMEFQQLRQPEGGKLLFKKHPGDTTLKSFLFEGTRYLCQLLPRKYRLCLGENKSETRFTARVIK